MDKTVDRRFHRALQIESNIYSIWYHGKANQTTPLSANSNSNYMGRSSPTLDNLPNENAFYRANGTSEPENISFKNVNYLSKKDFNDETDCISSPNSSKYNGISRKREDQIYVQDVSLQWNKNKNDDKGYSGRDQSPNSKFKGECLSNITRVCCPNCSLQLPLGKLRQVGTLVGNTWTKEEPKTPCRLVVPDFQSTQASIPKTMCQVSKITKQDEPRESCNNPKNPLMMVEMIANKKDRKRVANYLNCDIESGDPSTCICYMEFIKKYGFDHIIIIGERYAGLLFLDCYGRVFEWDDSMTGVLRPLGDYLNYLNKAPKVSHVMWDYESDGTVVEFEVAKYDSPTFDIPTNIAKKKKNSKKKNSKKKLH